MNERVAGNRAGEPKIYLSSGTADTATLPESGKELRRCMLKKTVRQIKGQGYQTQYGPLEG